MIVDGIGLDSDAQLLHLPNMVVDITSHGLIDNVIVSCGEVAW